MICNHQLLCLGLVVLSISSPATEVLLGCGVPARVSFLPGSWSHPGGWHPQHLQRLGILRTLETTRQADQWQTQDPEKDSQSLTQTLILIQGDSGHISLPLGGSVPHRKNSNDLIMILSPSLEDQEIKWNQEYGSTLKNGHSSITEF